MDPSMILTGVCSEVSLKGACHSLFSSRCFLLSLPSYMQGCPPGPCPQMEPVIVEWCGDKVASVLTSEDTFLATVTWTTQCGSTQHGH